MNHKCILQVEDEEGDIFLFKHVFERTGFDCPLRVVTDGQMAIDYLMGTGEFADREKYPLPRLILLDLKLPKRNGLEVLEWLRQDPLLKYVVVIVFSSSSHPSDLQRAYELGANSYIQKPSAMEKTFEIARLLKTWWLGYNRFAPPFDVQSETPRF